MIYLFYIWKNLHSYQRALVAVPQFNTFGVFHRYHFASVLGCKQFQINHFIVTAKFKLIRLFRRFWQSYVLQKAKLLKYLVFRKTTLHY